MENSYSRHRNAKSIHERSFPTYFSYIQWIDRLAIHGWRWRLTRAVFHRNSSGGGWFGFWILIVNWTKYNKGKKKKYGFDWLMFVSEACRLFFAFDFSQSNFSSICSIKFWNNREINTCFPIRQKSHVF